MLIFSSLSSSCSSFLVPVLFCCGCLLLPACLLFALSRTDPAFLEIPHSQVCRTGRAKLNLSMRKNPHENAFSLFATLVKRVKTDRRPKNFIFSKPFFATKTTVFCTPTCPKPTRKPFFAYIHEKKQNRLFEKRPYHTPPPPTPAKSNFVGGSGVFEAQTPKKPGIRYVAVTLLLLLLLPAVAGGKQHGMATICIQTVAKHERAANRVQAISKPAGASMLALLPQNDVFRPLSSSSVTVPGIRQKSYMSYQNQPVMDRTEATTDLKTKICSCIAWPTQECRMLLRGTTSSKRSAPPASSTWKVQLSVPFGSSHSPPGYCARHLRLTRSRRWQRRYMAAQLSLLFLFRIKAFSN